MEYDLKALLDSWRPAVPGPSDFRRNVWQRIERQRQAPGWFALALEWVARPRVAVALVAAALLFGTAAGTEISSSTQTSKYLRSVNPYAQAR